MSAASGRVAVVFRGEVKAPLNPRLKPMVDALEATGLTVESVPFHHDYTGALDQRLRGFARGDGVLVWADPLGEDGDRSALDQVLRRTEAAGVWVSARPEVVDRLGTKEVLVTTGDLGWGSDTHLYRQPGEFARDFPARLAAQGVRVLKASRGNGGRTVWKVRLPGWPDAPAPGLETEVVVQHARDRDDTATTVTLAALVQHVENAHVFGGWAGTGCLVDQEFIPGITRGIVRCYLVGGVVVGFARQYPDGVVPDGPLHVLPDSEPSAENVMGLPSPKTMYPPAEPALAELRARLEDEWVPAMATVLGLRRHDLPALWDIDVISTGPVSAGQRSDVTEPAARFMLCEINASSIIPFPPAAPGAVAQHVVSALANR